jgi:hypothetical protein
MRLESGLSLTASTRASPLMYLGRLNIIHTGTGSRAEFRLTGRLNSCSFLRELANGDFKERHTYLTVFAFFLFNDLEHSFTTVVREKVVVLNFLAVILL